MRFRQQLVDLQKQKDLQEVVHQENDWGIEVVQQQVLQQKQLNVTDLSAEQQG